MILERRAQRSGKMITPLAPVETRPTKWSAGPACLQIHPKLMEEVVTAHGQFTTIIRQRQVAGLNQGVGHANREPTCQMIVACACEAHVVIGRSGSANA